MTLLLRQHDTNGLEQTPEALTPRLVDAALPGEDLEVQVLEDARVVPLELGELRRDGMTAMHVGERRARGGAMVEERVVEIEQDGAHHRRRGVSHAAGWADCRSPWRGARATRPSPAAAAAAANATTGGAARRGTAAVRSRSRRGSRRTPAARWRRGRRGPCARDGGTGTSE